MVGRGEKLARAALLAGALAATPAQAIPQGIGTAQLRIEPLAAPHACSGRFGLDDYARITRLSDLQLSPRSTRIIYLARTTDLNANAVVTTAFVQPTALAPPRRLGTDMRQLTWLDESAIAFVGTNVSSRLQKLDIDHGVRTTLFQFDAPITAYARSGSGTFAVLLSRPVQLDPGPDANTVGGAFRIDPEWATPTDFLRPEAAPGRSRRRGVLLIARLGAQPIAVDVGGSVKSFSWSPNGERLAITYAGDREAKARSLDTPTSVAVFDADGVQRARIEADAEDGPSRAHRAVGWHADGMRLLLERWTPHHPWVSAFHPEVGYVRLDEDRVSVERGWARISSYANRYFLQTGERPLVESSVQGRRSLFRVTTAGLKPVAGLGLSASQSSFTFAAHGEQSAFVGESLTTLPEIFLVRAGKAPIPITRVNIALPCAPAASSVQWQGDDGVAISGWLLVPPGARPRGGWPLLTLVHGGPVTVYANQFAPYFNYWPYPLEALATNGVAVFIPNYRGTATFDEAFQDPSALDAEPVSDVLRGVDALVSAGIADPARLGIAGQSHGAWLAALLVARTKTRFRAAAIAESGAGNMFGTYFGNAGILNREVHDIVMGGSVFDEPQRYLELSPSLQMMGVRTPLLLEAGALDSAPAMLDLMKAADREKMLGGMYVYPRTDHNIVEPRLQRQSASLTACWFGYWLADRSCDADGGVPADWATIRRDIRR